MKFKSIVLIIIAVAAISIPSKNALAISYNNAISANPLGLAFGIFNATYENRISAGNSFTIYASYWSYVDWAAYGLGGSYRWYLNNLVQNNKKPLEGLSAGPAISIGFWKWSGSSIYNNYGNGTSVSIGGEAAYKWVFSGFVVEPIISISFNLVNINGLIYKPFGLGCNLGYAW